MIKIHKLVRSARKTVALIIESDGTLTVRAPFQATEEQIQAFIRAKSAWIQSKQAGARQKTARRVPYAFQESENFYYLGSRIPLKITEKTSPQLAYDGNALVLSRQAQPRAKELLSAWYRRQARQQLQERLEQLARQFGLSYKNLRISSARTRWGSCSSTGTISLTWRLVMAPVPVIDYVIVHELAHIKEKNHSKRFWNLVSAMMPDYQQRQKWLKQYGHLLSLDHQPEG